MHAVEDHTTSVPPLLSICIPTFNRAACLEKLLGNLETLKRAHGRDVDICLSNNCSTDRTGDLIATWQARFDMRVEHQDENIGATRNVLAVSRMASGRWTVIMGDDDGFIPDKFDGLMQLLKLSDSMDWILMGVADQHGQERYLGNLTSERHSACAARQLFLKTGLHRFGFIGMHVLPSSRQKMFSALTVEQAQPWPHLALLMRHMHDGPVRVFNTTVVQQAAGGGALFWNMADWGRLNLRKIDIIDEARTSLRQHRLYFDLLMLREIYSSTNFRILVLWKALESKDFQVRALKDHAARYSLVKLMRWAVVPHGLLLLLIAAMPVTWVLRMLGLVGKGATVSAYEKEKASRGSFNGVSRKI